MYKLIPIPVALLFGTLALPVPHADAATLRCRDTLHGQACDGERGYEVRCRNDLLGETCDDNRGRTIRCRDTLHGRDCEDRRR
jgi:hypothetical protein